MNLARGKIVVATCALLNALVATPILARDNVEFRDPCHDATIRRTNSCACGELAPDQALPDVEKIVISAWQPAAPSVDPFVGWEVDHKGAHIFRIDVVLHGVINPPGPLGLGGGDYDPFKFGPSPLYGFIEIDVDDDRDTGGDQASSASLHYLANVARFGARPMGVQGDRAAKSAADVFQPWNQSPQIRLSGADWVLTFCGCFTPGVIFKSNPEATFVAGSTWILSGRFFPRADGYTGGSLMTGGSAAGAYDPIVQVQFSHSQANDKTTVSLVWALDQIGAAQLAGHPNMVQPFDNFVYNDTSIQEGVADLINNVHSGLPGHLTPGSFEYQITNRWGGKSVSSASDVTRWKPTFIVGTADAAPTDGLYIWTDVGFQCMRGDMDGNGAITYADRKAVADFISQHDGGVDDADGVVDGHVTIDNFGVNFCMFDIDGDGVVGPEDLAFFDGICPADFNHSGTVTVQDIFDYLAAWFMGSPSADSDRSGTVSVRDLFDFLAAWFVGC